MPDGAGWQGVVFHDAGGGQDLASPCQIPYAGGQAYGETKVLVARILRPGGLFCDCHYAWPPALPWEVEQAFLHFKNQMNWPIVAPSNQGKRSPHDEQLERMQKSGQFRHVRELFLSSEERGNAARLIGLACSTSVASQFLRLESAEAQQALAELRQIAEQMLGDEMRPWYFSYRVKIAVK